jgi:hypothetical protein
MAAVIEAAHYAEARSKLMADPIVVNMYLGLADVATIDMAHEDGTPRFEFMQAANRTYAGRGGTNQAHLGAVAEALIAYRKHDEKAQADFDAWLAAGDNAAAWEAFKNERDAEPWDSAALPHRPRSCAADQHDLPAAQDR